MNIDITKYLKNKDVKIKNDDFDFDALEKDLYKDYTKNSEVQSKIKESTKDMVSKSDFDKLQSDYSTLETNYNNQTKVLSDTNDKMARVSLESKLVRKGFKEENFDEIIKLRNSLYADEKDDQKAVDAIAEKFKNTYLQETDKKGTNYTSAPNEAGMSGKNANDNAGKDIKITRNTSIKDMMIPVTK